MKQKYGYNWSLVWPGFIAIPAVVFYIVLREGNLTRFDLIILTIIAIGMMIYRAMPMAKVVLDETHITITYLLPFQHGGHFLYEEIESYVELAIPRKNKKNPFGGLIKPKDKARISIWAPGTKNFKELNSILLEIFPKPDEIKSGFVNDHKNTNG